MAKTKLMTALLMVGLSAPAYAFNVKPPFDAREGAYLECSIVQHSPDRDRDPAYKINIELSVSNGNFQALNVTYTLVSGRIVDRTEQYPDGTTWTAMPRTLDWYWAGTHKDYNTQGHLYHNDSDGWMYTETISSRYHTYHMLADCHAMNAG
jgi:hypothetical protein